MRRTITVLVVYVAAAWVVLPAGRWLRRILVLPSVFEELLRWGLYGGAVVAGLMAWFYPRIASEPARGGGADGVSRAGGGSDRSSEREPAA